MSYWEAKTEVSNDLRSTSRSYVYVNSPDLKVYRGEITGTYNRNKEVTKGPDYWDWRTRLQSADNATTPLTGYKSYLNRASPCVYRYVVKGNNYTFGALVGDVYTPSFGSPNPGIDSRADNEARSALLQSYIEAQNSFRGGNFLAELGDTVRMLASPLKSIYRRTETFVGRVGKLRNVYRQDEARYGKLLGDAWLAYSFGVKPLANDVNDLTRTLNKMREDGFYEGRMPISGTGRAREQYARLLQGFADFGPLGGPLSKTILTEISVNSVSYDGVVRGRSSTTAAIQEFGVGIFDIVPAVWEAVPWSFLVDYFTNTGEILDSLRYADANLSWLKRTVRNSVTRDFGEPKMSSDSSRDVSVSGGRCHTTRVYVNRYPLTVMPYPQFHFKVPGFPSLKWANVAALTASIKASHPLGDKFFQL